MQVDCDIGIGAHKVVPQPAGIADRPVGAVWIARHDPVQIFDCRGRVDPFAGEERLRSGGRGGAEAQADDAQHRHMAWKTGLHRTRYNRKFRRRNPPPRLSRCWTAVNQNLHAPFRKHRVNLTIMEESFAVKNAAARHPVRRKLRPPVPAASPSKSGDDQDLKLFALSFTAFFICIYSLIF